MITQLVIIGLASWRVAALISYEDGPFDVFARFRWAIGMRPRREYNTLAKMVQCVWCLGVWVAPLMFGLWYVHWAIPMVLAIAAVVPIVDRWTRPP